MSYNYPGLFIVNIEQILQIVLLLPLLSFSKGILVEWGSFSLRMCVIEVLLFLCLVLCDKLVGSFIDHF